MWQEYASNESTPLLMFLPGLAIGAGATPRGSSLAASATVRGYPRTVADAASELPRGVAPAPMARPGRNMSKGVLSLEAYSCHIYGVPSPWKAERRITTDTGFGSHVCIP